MYYRPGVVNESLTTKAGMQIRGQHVRVGLALSKSSRDIACQSFLTRHNAKITVAKRVSSTSAAEAERWRATRHRLQECYPEAFSGRGQNK